MLIVRKLYIGFVISKNNKPQKPVSVAESKQDAGDLIRKWIKDNDPKQLDWQDGGVETLLDPEYIKFGNPKINLENSQKTPKFWFGNHLNCPTQNLNGIVYGIEFFESDSGAKFGFWYWIRWQGKISHKIVHEDYLELFQKQTPALGDQHDD